MYSYKTTIQSTKSLEEIVSLFMKSQQYFTNYQIESNILYIQNIKSIILIKKTENQLDIQFDLNEENIDFAFGTVIFTILYCIWGILAILGPLLFHSYWYILLSIVGIFLTLLGQKVFLWFSKTEASIDKDLILKIIKNLS